MEIIKGVLIAFDVILIFIFMGLSVFGAKEKSISMSVSMAVIMAVIMLNVSFIILS